MNATALVQKVWNFCHTLRDDGVGYGDYLEQLTYLLFLKLAREYTREPYLRPSRIPAAYDWASLRGRTGEPLESHYLATLHRLQGGEVRHILATAGNFTAYPADEWDSHPNSTCQRKATAEFVPLLNYWYDRWRTQPSFVPGAMPSCGGWGATLH